MIGITGVSNEAALIDAIVNARSIAKAKDLVPSHTHYFDPHLGRIYKLLLELDHRGKELTPETVMKYLTPVIKEDPEMMDAWMVSVGGTAYHSEDTVEFYAGEVAEEYRIRCKRELAHEFAEMADTNDEVTSGDLVRMVDDVRKLDPIHDEQKMSISSAMDEMIEIAEERYEKTKNGKVITGLSYGIEPLNSMTDGMQPGQLVIVAARPSIGKTSFGIGVADQVAVTDAQSSMFVSLEMTSPQIAARMVSLRSGVPFGEVVNVSENKLNRSKVFSAMNEVKASPLIIPDKPGLQIPDLRKMVLDRAEQGMKFCVIDYLGLLRFSKFSSGESNYKEVSEISKTLKEIAREANIPIMALAQLNRGPSKVERAPRMSDLRDSGSIEQDADLVILLHRDDKVRKDHEHNTFEPCRIIVDKNRNGPTGTIRASFEKDVMQFGQWTRDDSLWPESL
jgi:replicative DNA helicase